MRKTTVKVDGPLGQHLRNKAQPGIVIPVVKDYLLRAYAPDAARRTDIIHPSEMAKPDWCPRSTFDRITGTRLPELEPFDFVRTSIFAEGNQIHNKWQGWLRGADMLWGDWRCRLCNEVISGVTHPNMAETSSCGSGFVHWWEYDEIPLHDDEYMIAGHADGAMNSTLLEFKSVGLGTIRIDAPELLKQHQQGQLTDLNGLFKSITRPLKSHLKQGDIYLWLARRMGLPFDTMTYVYEFKANQMAKEFTIKYSEERVQPMLDIAGQIAYCVREGKPFPRCEGECRYCGQEDVSVKRRRAV
jgi:hypothetical protein